MWSRFEKLKRFEEYDKTKEETEQLKKLKDRLITDLTMLKEISNTKEAEIKKLKQTLSTETRKCITLEDNLNEVVEERDALKRKISKLEEALSEETRDHKISTAKLLEDEKSIQGLGEQVNILKDEFACCREDKARLEYEKVIINGEEITLKQLDKRVIQTCNEQIEYRVQERLEVLKNEVWPTWHTKHHGEQVELKAQSIVNELARNQLWEEMFKALNTTVASKRPFRVTCNKCQTSNDIVLMPVDVEALVRTGEVWLECLNQNCMDEPLFNPYKMFGSKRHKIKVLLDEFLSQL